MGLVASGFFLFEGKADSIEPGQQRRSESLSSRLFNIFGVFRGKSCDAAVVGVLILAAGFLKAAAFLAERGFFG